MCILLSHDCLMLLVAVPPLSLFRQLEASSRRESWYLCWGFWTDHKQEELLPRLRLPATDTNTYIHSSLGITGQVQTVSLRFNRWGVLCVFCIAQVLAGCVTNHFTNTHFPQSSSGCSSFSDWSGKMFHLHLALECVQMIARCRSGSLPLPPDWLRV